ncbi:hypothetical protein COS55_04035 [Candidatus Shapirobacteria bacterium CG03_land_8_20_14_0_80_40_19]|uniref:Uncharacterized protein n=4 Tax=Candidatus Shapironibacteriota TaxID=1752721 RepID=A0A2M7BAS8_9BACT|nr:MAG: hypothetical protein COV89_01250 [Candidatus Shapirobacteria bacterium CG11_big_fil_rev_8_21_14_0_20_40_12]PIV00204.1 MAG: hypothetical protein COS55_04035 [Candidatus Shapirobacteria bacterium CG03_land_8_20_14_0_80_40_19]PJC28517.1 MAG: hypothetical protein CO053_04210 [Candidatus Shapirobacteria bacterium CG_4_9_14_0_2_um_filter_40_11]PJC76137.1 MAG: hypothetical protein CO010_03375 [Candidatus Shapirobacteria bacterium CG_4_8_14_3_um_filter_39_11]
MSKHVLTLFLFFSFMFVGSSGVLAAKKRVWSTQTTTKTTTATRPTFSVKFRSDRRALNVSFYNLNTASSTSYELTYLGNDLEQGVVGSINPNEGSSASRLLLFGSCSGNVCTYHKNIQNMQLKITSKLKSGKTLIKRYRIKV